jgi:excisionase family DNA binding protein
MKPTSSLQNPILRDVPEAAEYLTVSIHFIRRLVRERRIPFVKLGPFVRFDTEDLDAFVDAGRQPAISV